MIPNESSRPSTLIFDYPSVKSLSGHLSEQFWGLAEVADHQPPLDAKPTAEEAIALVGLACRFPGAPDAESFWRLLVLHGVMALLRVVLC